MPLPVIAAPRTRQQIESNFAPGGTPAPVGFWDAAKAGFDNAWNVQRLGAREEATRAAMWQRWSQIRQRTGQQLPVSSTMAWLPDVSAGTGFGGDDLASLQPDAPVSDAENAQRVEDLRAKMPAQMAGVQSDAELHRDVGTRLNAIAGRAAAAQQGNGLGATVGGIAAQAVDPVNLAVGALTGEAGEAVPLAKALLLGGGKQALTWGALSAAEAPFKAREAAQYGGPDYTLRDAVGDVVQSAAGAFAVHGVGTLLGAAGRRFLGGRADVAPAPDLAAGGAPEAPGEGGLPATTPSNVIDADFTPVETPVLAGPPDRPALLALPAPEAVVGPDAMRGAAQVVDKAAVTDTAIGTQRDGGDVDAAHAAVAQGEAPTMPEPTQDPDTLLTNDDPASGGVVQMPTTAPGVTIGDSTTYRGRDIHAATFDPAVVNTAPDVFQYKAGGDAAGVTDRLRGVETWDPTSAGRSMVYEDGAGAYTIADGHQRLGLAKRLADQNPTLDALLFRQADGWSAQDVRTLAALKNIREGSGTPLDAAKVLRDYPEALNDDSLPVTGTLAEQGRGLARLSDDAFRAVVNDVAPQHYAALIGNMAGDRPDLHAGIVDLLHRGRPANVDEARALVSEALEADWAKHEGVQDDMFGGEPAQSTVIARAKVKAAVLRQVRGDAKLFATLTRNADAIEAGGNALARSANEANLAVNRAAEAMISKLAYRDGEVGAAMRKAAEDVHGGAKPAEAARRVADLVRRAIADGDEAQAARKVRLDAEAPSTAAEKATESFAEPGGAGQKEQLGAKPEEAEAEAAARAGDAFPGLFDDIRAEPNPARVAAERLAQCAPGA